MVAGLVMGAELMINQKKNNENDQFLHVTCGMGSLWGIHEPLTVVLNAPGGASFTQRATKRSTANNELVKNWWQEQFQIIQGQSRLRPTKVIQALSSHMFLLEFTPRQGFFHSCANVCLEKKHADRRF